MPATAVPELGDHAIRSGPPLSISKEYNLRLAQWEPDLTNEVDQGTGHRDVNRALRRAALSGPSAALPGTTQRCVTAPAGAKPKRKTHAGWQRTICRIE